MNKAKAEGFFCQCSKCSTFSHQHSAQSVKSPLSTKKFTLSSPLPTPPAKNKENTPRSQNPNRNRKNDKSGLINSSHDPLNRSGLFSYQTVRQQV
jgi:hypothetical protein